MSSLEKSLDELLGNNSTRSRDTRRTPRYPRRDRERSRERRPRSRDFRDRYEAPRQTKLQRLSHGKTYLKITNLHYDVGENDLKSLFETVGETSFVLIEYNSTGRSSGTAYVGFTDPENNEIAVQKFDKKKAVGEIIRVEQIKPLNVLVASKTPRRPNVSSGSKGVDTRGVRSRPKRPTVEDLDEELNRYMNKEDDPKKEENSKESRQSSTTLDRTSKSTVEDLDKELDDYMKVDQPFPAATE